MITTRAASLLYRHLLGSSVCAPFGLASMDAILKRASRSDSGSSPPPSAFNCDSCPFNSPRLEQRVHQRATKGLPLERPRRPDNPLLCRANPGWVVRYSLPPYSTSQ